MPSHFLIVCLLVPALLVFFYRSSTLSELSTTTALTYNMAAVLKTLVVAPSAKHTATVIFVHGLGDTGYGWQPVADMFRADPALSHVKWILPHSPARKVTANMGMEMPSWFDIISFGFTAPEDEEGMLSTVSSLNQLISNEIKENKIDPSRIVLGGFSQGAAMSLLTSLTTERKLAGAVVLSGWLPLRNKFKNMLSSHAPSLPLFWGHGTHDPLVKFQFALDSLDFIKGQLSIPVSNDSSSNTPGAGVLFHAYQGIGHSTSPKELEDLKEWLKQVIPK